MVEISPDIKYELEEMFAKLEQNQFEAGKIFPKYVLQNFYKVFEISNFHEKIDIFWEISFFRNFPVGWNPMDQALALTLPHFNTFI